MTNIRTSLTAAVFAFGFAAAASAQVSSVDTQLSPGTEVASAGAVGQPYIASLQGDWAVRCIKTDNGTDPCNLYQTLQDGDGNNVAEISLYKLPQGGQAEAGATVVTPLETLLNQQITISFDQGTAKRYPFTYCDPNSCYARIALSGADIASMKAGASGELTLVPLRAPDKRIGLNISLKGFTAGYDAVTEANHARDARLKELAAQ
ncbi:invasion associated locus B family protein [Candidatus Halocynthiibacter alkanivorans]|uniref:invasion associated locus B family protein n=1 Tax=Candidatus Halocynthiibacter alkanivorans TaxID=2267619 RepID=UPI000DF2073B|nr:invasion associated locus B family protein [Candidatus Halocynthiibacter alkanivorans]